MANYFLLRPAAKQGTTSLDGATLVAETALPQEISMEAGEYEIMRCYPKAATVEVAAPVDMSELSTYYGTSAGDILVHIDPFDAETVTLNGSDEVTAVENKGGGGSSYDLTGGGTKPGYDDEAGVFNFARTAKTALIFGTTIDPEDMHILVVARNGNVSFAGSAILANYISDKLDRHPLMYDGQTTNNSRIQIGAFGTTSGNITGDGITGNDLVLLEIRNEGGTGWAVVNGQTKMSELTVAADYDMITELGCRRGHGSPDKIGAFIAVKTASGYDIDNPEPAVLAARAALATAYGIDIG